MNREGEPSHRYLNFEDEDEPVTKGYYWQLHSENRESIRRMETRLDDSFVETNGRVNDLGHQVTDIGHQVGMLTQAFNNFDN